MISHSEFTPVNRGVYESQRIRFLDMPFDVIDFREALDRLVKLRTATGLRMP